MNLDRGDGVRPAHRHHALAFIAGNAAGKLSRPRATQSSPDEIAGALLTLAREKTGEKLRENFLQQFTLKLHLARLGEAIRSVETDAPASSPEPVRQAA